eukprot:1846565-Rhodomonas_salina.2
MQRADPVNARMPVSPELGPEAERHPYTGVSGTRGTGYVASVGAVKVLKHLCRSVRCRLPRGWGFPPGRPYPRTPNPKTHESVKAYPGSRLGS